MTFIDPNVNFWIDEYRIFESILETKLMNTVVLELPLDALALPGIPPEDLASAEFESNV